MNTGIKKEPAFDLKQAIRKLADRVRAMGESGEEQDKKNLPTKLELYELLSSYGTTYKDIKEAYPQTTQNEEQFEVSNMTYEDMKNIGKQIEAELDQISENKPDGQYITDYEIYEVLSKYGVKYKDLRKVCLAVEEKLKNMPMPRLYIAPHAVDSGVGIHLANSDYVAENKEMKKYIPEESTVGQVVIYDSSAWEDEACKALEEFIITVNNIGDSIEGNLEIIEWLCDKWSSNEHLRRLGIFAGKILKVWDGYQCFRNIYEKREEEIGRIMQAEECTREEAEAKVRQYLPLWLTSEVISMGFGMFIDNKVKERFLFPKDEKTILWEDYGT